MIWVGAAEDQQWREFHLEDFIYFWRFECKVKMLYITICSHFISLSRSFLRARLNSTFTRRQTVSIALDTS